MMMPNSGWLPTAADAAKQVEDYWDAIIGTLATQEMSDERTATHPAAPVHFEH
jgi:hypothetical protein